MARVICIQEIVDGDYTPAVRFVDVNNMPDGDYKIRILKAMGSDPKGYRKVKSASWKRPDYNARDNALAVCQVKLPAQVDDYIVLYLGE